MLSARFPQVAALNKIGRPATVGGKSILRLRAVGSSAEAQAACAALKAAGESCLVVQLMQAAIYGLAGPELTADERAFFRDARPAGYILFRRNIETPAQLRRADRRAARARGP